MRTGVPGVRKTSALCLLSLFSCAFSLSGNQAAGTSHEFLSGIIETYAKLRGNILDSGESYSVSNLLIKRKNATFYFRSGIISFCEPVRGMVTGAVFKGEGVFSFQTGKDFEKNQINRFFDRDEVVIPVEYIFFRFTDTTHTELLTKMGEKLQNAGGETSMREFYEGIREYLYEDLCYDTAYRMAWDITIPDRQGFFFADCQSREKDRMKIRNFQFTYDPRGYEDVSLSYYRIHRVGSPHHLLCSLRSDAVGTSYDLRDPADYDFQMPRYTMDVTLEGNGDALIHTDILLEDRRGGLQFIIFKLAKGLEIQSVTEGDNKAPVLFFRQMKKDGSLRLIFNTPLGAQEKRHLYITYKGKILERYRAGQWRLKDFLNWYPRYGYNFRSSFDITYHSPKHNSFISVGTRMDVREDENYVHSRWVIEEPVHIITFNLGDFKDSAFERDGMPVLNVYGNPLIPDSFWERIAGIVFDSLRFYGELFQPYPFPGITISEAPIIPGTSFPGFINLSPKTIESDEPDKGEMVYTHEVAHQWWGHLTAWRTYHDIWLSEGCAEYSAMLFLENKHGGREKFINNLETKRDRIFSRLKSLKKAGPVWMGTRLALQDPADYNLLIYSKGAYIFHMLRFLLRDYENSSDDRFFSFLKDFSRIYTWRSVSTSGLQELAEEYYGGSLQWFFDQWVYGVAVPDYNFYYAVEKDDNAEWVLHGRLAQEEVPPGFRMYVPVSVVQKSGGKITKHVLVDGIQSEFTIGPFHSEPEQIICNDYNAVLCRVEYK